MAKPVNVASITSANMPIVVFFIVKNRFLPFPLFVDSPVKVLSEAKLDEKSNVKK